MTNFYSVITLTYSQQYTSAIYVNIHFVCKPMLQRPDRNVTSDTQLQERIDQDQDQITLQSFFST